MANNTGFYFLPVIPIKPDWHCKVPTVLDEECLPIDLNDKSTSEVLEDVIFEMFRTLYATVGVGLAAPQVGIRWQLIVIDTQNIKDPNNGKLILINPEIIEAEEDTEVGAESCLSIPFYSGNVPRYKKIKVKYLSLSGTEEIIDADGWYARILQHEMDHLKGKLYLSRISMSSDLQPQEGAHIGRNANRTMEKLKVRETLQKRSSAKESIDQ